MATAVVIVGSLGVVPAAANAVTGVVDNTYVRTCSYITGRCTAYTQINGPHNSSVPNAYRTYWTFGVIL